MPMTVQLVLFHSCNICTSRFLKLKCANMLCRRSRGFGFIEYRDPRDADDAMYRMDGSNIGGRDITVSHVPEPTLKLYTNLGRVCRATLAHKVV